MTDERVGTWVCIEATLTFNPSPMIVAYKFRGPGVELRFAKQWAGEPRLVVGEAYTQQQVFEAAGIQSE